MMRAFIDESGSNTKLDPDAYLLGSVIISDEHVEEVRHQMAALRLRGQRKLHWREESDRRQMAITEIIVELPIEGILVSHVDAVRRPEERRHRTIATLLPELHFRGVDYAEFESRGTKDDERDRTLVDDMRRSRRFDPARPTLRVAHTEGGKEPCLWIADAICGAVVAHRTGDGRFVELYQEKLQLVHCP